VGVHIEDDARAGRGVAKHDRVRRGEGGLEPLHFALKYGKHVKRDLYTSKETFKRDLGTSKETYKRDLKCIKTLLRALRYGKYVQRDLQKRPLKYQEIFDGDEVRESVSKSLL